MIYSHKNSKIVFTHKIIDEINKINDKYKTKVFILTDSNTVNKCLPLIDSAVYDKKLIFTINAGEEQKNINNIVKIWDFLNKNGADRQSILLNLGGGVVCDMGGFAASTFKRGIKFVQIPTTLLAQVDASVGGKTGFNLNKFKNEIGSFAFPEKVIIHTGFLQTLPTEHILSGFGEMLKHAFIKDYEYCHKLLSFNLLQDFNTDIMLQMIEHSVMIKNEFVMADPTEQSIRKALNFGHTVGHAIESFFLGTKHELSHGRAIAYGMIIELYLSNIKLNFDVNKLNNIKKSINQLYGKLFFDKKDYNKLYELMLHDKKNKNGNINCTLLKDIAKYEINQKISKTDIFKAFDYYLSTSLNSTLR